jgi:hypothetical protein
MDTTKEQGFMPACMDYFGKHSGQTLVEFRAEVLKLTPADKEEIKTGLETLGYKIKPLQ